MAAPVPSLAGKRCFVTGAASGIGQATALAAAERGADLYLTDIAAPGLEETAAAIRAAGGRVSYTRAAGLLGLPWHAPYSAAKFGLRGVSEVLRFDLRPHRIGVSLVCPGGVKTPLVGTVEIVGIDNDDPEVRKMKRRFERHAVSPAREDPRRHREEPLPRLHLRRHPPRLLAPALVPARLRGDHARPQPPPRRRRRRSLTQSAFVLCRR